MGQREKLGKEPSGRGPRIFEETGRNKKKHIDKQNVIYF